MARDRCSDKCGVLRIVMAYGGGVFFISTHLIPASLSYAVDLSRLKFPMVSVGRQ